jgi:hypothetical protein
MKLSVERTQTGVKIDFTKDAKSKPVTIELTEAQIRTLSGIIDMALKVDVFKFSVDL